MNERKVKEIILKELSKFKFKRYTKGFKYLNEAIYLCIIDKDVLTKIKIYYIHSITIHSITIY